MKFANGVHAQFDSGFQSPSRSHIEIVGDQACLHVPEPFKPGRKSEIVLRRGDEMEILKIKGQELYMGEVDDMCDAVLLGKPTRIPLPDSRGNVAVILALLESAETGRPVRL
jgi:predicted dehydrogenase